MLFAFTGVTAFGMGGLYGYDPEEQVKDVAKRYQGCPIKIRVAKPAVDRRCPSLLFYVAF